MIVGDNELTLDGVYLAPVEVQLRAVFDEAGIPAVVGLKGEIERGKIYGWNLWKDTRQDCACLIGTLAYFGRGPGEDAGMLTYSLRQVANDATPAEFRDWRDDNGRLVYRYDYNPVDNTCYVEKFSYEVKEGDTHKNNKELAFVMDVINDWLKENS